VLDSPDDIPAPLTHLNFDSIVSTHNITPSPSVLNSSTYNDIVNHHPITIKSKTGIFKPKVFNTEIVLQSHVPTSVNEAISSPLGFKQ